MKNKCDCYHTEIKRANVYNPLTGQPFGGDIEVGVCWGTRERDRCSCGGDKTRCSFYADVREEALKTISTEDAISHYTYGISHDIFSGPVVAYAKLSIEALEKQIPKKVVRYSDDESDHVYCPCCHECIGSNDMIYEDFYCRGFAPMYCQECGQAMILR